MILPTVLFCSVLAVYVYSIVHVIFSGATYYKMTNLDNRIQNPDQVLTQDVDKLCESLVDLYSNLSKVWAVLNIGGAYL